MEERGESPSLLFLSDNTLTMTDAVDEVVRDLRAETSSLRNLLGSLPLSDWDRPTPASGWTVADQVIHLGLFDRRCMWSMTDESKFRADLKDMMALGGVDALHNSHRGMSPDDLLSWWSQGSDELIRSADSVDMKQRCAWYGPSMSARSMLTARFMETWAHGLDIADAIGLVREDTDSIYHVAHIGVRAMPFAFATNRREQPDGDVFVELHAPSGAVWTWGTADATSSVRGTATGFCRAVTQRRHLNDCGLEIVGEPATQWMSIAQAFAGPPGEGRTEGQFG